MNITQLIGVNILTILTFLCGYAVGYVAGSNKPFSDIKKAIRKVVVMGEVGAVNRPTQKEILNKTNPWHKRIEEGKQEMRKVLDKLNIKKVV